MNILIGILIPFLGTSLGAACVYAMKKEMNKMVNKILLGFASGVMMAAAVWSLIIPSIDMSQNMGKLSFIPAAVGVLVGILFLFSLDKIVPHMHINSKKEEGTKKYKLSKTTKLVLSVVIHNIPEGMAIGIVFAAVMNEANAVTLASAIALSIGIAIQNFPEGAAVSIPLRREGNSRLKSFWYGQASGIVEPIAGVIGAAAVLFIRNLLPYALSFAAGAMIFVVVEELIPEAQVGNDTDISSIGVLIGFTIMMILDVALG